MTTKILALTDALGNLVRVVLLPGHRFDTVGVAPLIDGIAFGGLIADKAFDSNAIIANLNERGAKIVISQHPRRALPLRLDTGRRGRKCTQEVRARELKYAKECLLCGGSTRANAPSFSPRSCPHFCIFLNWERARSIKIEDRSRKNQSDQVFRIWIGTKIVH